MQSKKVISEYVNFYFSDIIWSLFLLSVVRNDNDWLQVQGPWLWERGHWENSQRCFRRAQERRTSQWCDAEQGYVGKNVLGLSWGGLSSGSQQKRGVAYRSTLVCRRTGQFHVLALSHLSCHIPPLWSYFRYTFVWFKELSGFGTPAINKTDEFSEKFQTALLRISRQNCNKNATKVRTVIGTVVYYMILFPKSCM